MPQRLAREWIGEAVHFRGRAYTVLEVLDADSAHPLLVLRGQDAEIQPDQWGDAHRRVPGTVTVPLYDDGGAVNPDIAPKHRTSSP